ncbi:MAG: hypothetical protein CVU66_01395 [Deltaproteobacteria bacterium HGW-Deltaproteobacteria-23]|jgi:hypothetical protein|nr:MAG: hypothetical protein CVU66_01395 [Deltaproteobacteria bacterium HGW-Deltaproteobacteria-23]
MHTPFVQLHFTLEHSAGKLSPEALFAIRQLFPVAFRQANGCLGVDQGCRETSDCACRSIFEQKLTPDPAALSRYQKPPLPFAFKMPLLPEMAIQVGEVEISLVIIGEAINHLDLFIKAVTRLFKPAGSFKNWRIISIEAASGDGSLTAIPAEGIFTEFSSLPLLSFDELFNDGSIDCSGINIEFDAPLRLLHKGAPLRDIRFSHLAGALLRRISSLAYYYGGEELPHDFKWLAGRSREIVCTSSDLHWINYGGSLQGVAGSAQFSGELADFMPFLHLGSLLNIGKGSAYGMGSYRFSAE